MIGKDDSYEQPHVVLIDFGLATAFSTSVDNFSGTQGYMAPEIFQAGLWGPKGDIFSMGIVFFHVMVGHIPTKNGTMGPVLAPTAAVNTEECCKIARFVPLPWQKWPVEMPELRDLVLSMTNRDHRHRLRASQALEHTWFDSDSDADLPDEVLSRLLASSGSDFDEAAVLDAMAEACNLNQLRVLQEELRERDANGSGVVSEDDFVEVLESFSVRVGDAKAYAVATSDDGDCPYQSLMQQAISLKEVYNLQTLQDFLAKWHVTSSSFIDRTTVEDLLNLEAFEVPEDEIEELIDSMKATPDGRVALDEFRRCVMQDGRLGRRSDIDESRDLEDSTHWVLERGGEDEVCCVVS